MINSLCGAYLWRGTTEGHHSARVSWEIVTLSKEEGGLGIRDLNEWNKACTLKLVWLLFFRSGSIWVVWFTKTILNDCKSNFWTMKEKQCHSFAIKKLLRVRDVAYPWIKIKIGDGRSTRFWSEEWSSFGNIRKFLCFPPSSTLGIRPTATLSDIHRNGVWLIPPPRSDLQVVVCAHLTTVKLITEEDRFEWCPNGSAISAYSTGEIYRLIKKHQPLVPWNTVVWNPRGIPKHTFLTWLVVLNRCPTKDRIISWGLQTTPACILCNQAAESRDHLFFECPFSFAIWETLAHKARCSPINIWPQLFDYMQQRSCPKPERILGLIVWQALIYFTWTERNNRLHRHCIRTTNSITASAASLIKNKLSSFRDSNPAFSSTMLLLWFTN